VKANTNTRSKKSSRVVTRCDSSVGRTRVTRIRIVVIGCVLPPEV